MDMVTLARLTACVDQRWSPAIGDPTLLGWATVICYFVASLTCFLAGWIGKRDTRLWIMLAMFLLLLGGNKQLDLQSALTATGRCLAQMQGWYGQRRAVQFVFTLALLCTSGMGIIIALYLLRRSLHRVGLALLGFAILVTFVAIRALGFHHFDQFTDGYWNWGIGIDWHVELSGIFLIVMNVVAAIRRR